MPGFWIVGPFELLRRPLEVALPCCLPDEEKTP